MRPRPMSRPGAFATAAVAAFLLAAGWSPSAGAAAGSDEIVQMRDAAEGLRMRALSLSGRYLGSVEESRRARRLRRLVDGQQLYWMGDHESAALVLMAVVADPEARALPGFDDARFMLAESLRAAGRSAIAERYFSELVRENHADYALPAAIQILEIAFEERRFDALEEIHDLLPGLQGDADAGHLNYVAGKALHRRGRVEEALTSFGRIEPGSPYFERGFYYASTLLALQGHLGRALEGFAAQEERLRDAAGEEAADLRDLSALAQGRLHYEMGNLDEAVTAYARVRRGSRHFDRALYETSWTLIREAHYRRAARALETLGLVSVDPRIGPEAVLLRGEMELRLNAFDEARATFGELRDTYEPVEDALALHVDFLEGVLRQPAHARAGEELVRVTPAARPWVDLDPRARQALRTLSDFDALEREIHALERVVGELSRALDANQQLQAFPEVSEGWNVSHVIEAEAAALRVLVVEALASLLSGHMLPEESRRHDRMRATRMDLHRAMQDVPSNQQELAARQRSERARIREAELEAFRLEQSMLADRERADALEALLRDGQLDLEGEDEAVQRERVLDEVAALRAQAEAREVELDQRRLDLLDLRTGSAAAGVVSRSEREVLQAYRLVLSQEAAFLRSMLPRLMPSSAPGTTLQADEAQTLLRLEDELHDTRLALVEALSLAERTRAHLRESSVTGQEASGLLAQLSEVEGELALHSDGLVRQEAALEEAIRGLARTRGLDTEALRAQLQQERADVGAPIPEQERDRRAGIGRELGEVLDLLGDVDQAVDGFVREVVLLVEAEAEVLRARLAMESEGISALSARVGDTRGRGHQVAVASALEAVEGVRERFHEINLRANLGIIDISWRRREQQVAELDRLVQERAQVLELLDNDFADILEEN